MIDFYVPQNDKTPIEIALQVNDNRMVSAKKVYEFLELEPTNYSRWSKKNILDNKFAEENTDYKVFVFKDENPKSGRTTTDFEVLAIKGENLKGGRPTTDYMLTIAFAKKLCMQQANERGEQARNYFIKVEEKLKQIVSQNTKISPIRNDIDALKTFFNVLEHHHNVIDEHHNDIANMKDDIKLLKEQKPKEIIVQSSQIMYIPTESKEETYFSRKNIYSATAIGKAFNLSAISLNEILCGEGIIKKVKLYYVKNNEEGTGWIINDNYRAYKYSFQKYYGVKNMQNRKPTEITYGWTPKGVAFIIELLKRKGYPLINEIDNRTKARLLNRKTNS